MRVATLALVMLALPACESEGERAEAEYNIVIARVAYDNYDEKCRRGREVAEGYLRDRNTRAYDSWRLRAEGDCISGQLARLRPR